MFPLIPCKLTESGLCLYNKVVVCDPHNQHSWQIEKTQHCGCIEIDCGE